MPVGLTFEGFLICVAFYGVGCAIGYASERWRWGNNNGAASQNRRA